MILIHIRWLLILLLTGCSNLLCSNDIVNETKSPDGKYIATVFDRNCGATTANLRIVTLRLANDSLDSDEYKDWVFKIKGQPKVDVAWIAGDKLSINYAGSGEEPSMSATWKDVKISYK